MADRGYVLESGHLVIEGKSDYVLNSEKLKKSIFRITLKKLLNLYLIYQ